MHTMLQYRLNLMLLPQKRIVFVVLPDTVGQSTREINLLAPWYTSSYSIKNRESSVS